MSKVLRGPASLIGSLLLLAGLSAWAVSPVPVPVPHSPPDLIESIKAGDMGSLGQLLRSGANPNARDAEGMTALHYAAYQGNMDAAKLLAAAQADLNAKDSLGLTPLHAAAFEGRAHVANYLLQRGADAGAKDAAGNTPLHYAVLNGHLEAAEALLTGGADPLAANARNQSPAQIAQALGDQRMTALFDKAARASSDSGQKKAVRTYTDEDLVKLRQTSPLVFQEGGPAQAGTGSPGKASPSDAANSSPEDITGAYSRIDRLISERRDLEARLPSLQKECDDFKQREGSTSAQQGVQANLGGFYGEYKAAMERDRAAVCGPYEDAQSRLAQIDGEIADLRAAISSSSTSKGGTENQK